MKCYSPVRLEGEFGRVAECLFIKEMGLPMEDRSLSCFGLAHSGHAAQGVILLTLFCEDRCRGLETGPSHV